MKKAVRYAAILSLLVVGLALLPPLKVKALSIGVHAGQYFTYGTSDGSPWVNMNPSDAPPLSTWATYANFSTINLTITSVGYVENTITSNETVKFRNGTTFGPFPSGLNVYDGTGGGVFFIQAELDAGMRIYPGNPNSTYVINATWIDHGFWSGRRICQLNYTRYNPLENASSAMAVRRTIIYYDYATGVLLSAYEYAEVVSPKTYAGVEGELLFMLIDNNVGIPMKYPHPLDMTPIYTAIAIIAILVVVVVIVRATRAEPKRKHKRLRD
jgi:hypothetical protein